MILQIYSKLCFALYFSCKIEIYFFYIYTISYQYFSVYIGLLRHRYTQTDNIPSRSDHI